MKTIAEVVGGSKVKVEEKKGDAEEAKASDMRLDVDTLKTKKVDLEVDAPAAITQFLHKAGGQGDAQARGQDHAVL